MMRATVDIRQIGKVIIMPGGKGGISFDTGQEETSSFAAYLNSDGITVTLWAENQERAANTIAALRRIADALAENLPKLPEKPGPMDDKTVELSIIE